MTLRGWLYLGLCWVFAFLLGLYVGAPRAQIRWEAQGGGCQFGQSADGAWWHSGYETNNQLTSPCLQVGASYAWQVREHLGIGVRAAFVDLGRFTANGRAPADDIHPENSPIVTVNGSGTAYGPSLGGLIEWTSGNWTLGLEAGLLYYSGSWHVSGYNIQCPSQTYHVDWQSWQTTPYLGVTARWKHLFATFRRYASVTEHEQGSDNPGASGLTFGAAYALLLGAQF